MDSTFKFWKKGIVNFILKLLYYLVGISLKNHRIREIISVLSQKNYFVEIWEQILNKIKVPEKKYLKEICAENNLKDS